MKHGQRAEAGHGVALAPLVQAAAASDDDRELARVGEDIADCFEGGAPRQLAAVDFTDLQLNPTEPGRLGAEQPSTELVGASRGKEVAVVDRGHLATIPKEHPLNASKLVNPETAKKVGQLAGVDVLLTGNVLALEDSIRVTVKATAVETATILCATRADLPRTMAMREVLAVGVGDAAAPRPAAARAAAPTARPGASPSPTPAPGSPSEWWRFRFRSIAKRRDGAEVTVVLHVACQRDRCEPIAVDGDNPPLLPDNTGARWTFVRSGGLAVQTRALSKELHASEYRARFANFHAGGEQPVTFVFAADDEPSAGTGFDFSASVVGADLGSVPVGVAGMRLP